ncbi:helix-hairpin-helix domain-containing protein [Pasteurellaceae bacterium USgator11]|nr:helix-hairpin-helix domain-containing protein [Pasteurellaceae bacterium USgator41]TNG95624.1 helix-hairpin-helix domain-containing protein [Pasteurellaceae bacterium UScroc12]TNH00617.1 helix-hairpin-helix domain-containing protein [Pasteurellaceae bacterium USgator11]TNH01182.1 helix-hairpin-helix domain-containing protein [Pasteurellaceae bacterium UScroc31]
MPFTPTERDQLLALKGVGSTVIQRLEQLGIDSFEQLAKERSEEICRQVAEALGSSCWKNSPQAKAAIDAAIALAKHKS